MNFTKVNSSDVPAWWDGVKERFAGNKLYEDDFALITQRVLQGRCFAFASLDGKTKLLISYAGVNAGELSIEFVHSSQANAVFIYWNDVREIALIAGCHSVVCRALSKSRLRLYQQAGFKMDDNKRLVKRVES